MVLSKERPREIRYCSVELVLTPELPQERHRTIAKVVFPTGIDRRDDLGSYIMKATADQSKAPEPKPSVSAELKPLAPASKPGSKPEAKPDAKDDLKTLPLPEGRKNWSCRRTASLKLKRKNG